MANQVKIKDVTFVDGVAVQDLSNDDLLFKISVAQAEVDKLKKMGLESKTVDAMIKSQEDAISGLVKLLDARFKK